MARYKRNKLNDRRIVSNVELAGYFKVSRNTITNHLKKYKDEYNPRDIYSVLRLYDFLKTRIRQS